MSMKNLSVDRMRFPGLRHTAMILACLAPLLASREVQAHKDENAAAGKQATAETKVQTAGLQERFQAAFDRAYKTVSAPHKAIVMSPAIKLGDEYRLHCSPQTLGEHDELSISFGSVGATDKSSLVVIDEADRLFLVSSTSPDEYIGDNSLQPGNIRPGTSVSTAAATTYGHMDDSGYPYAAFGAAGRHLILLVDDGLVFGKHSLKGSRNGIPKVVAGCVVRWAGLH
jgi:hypothetical protein